MNKKIVNNKYKVIAIVGVLVLLVAGFIAAYFLQDMNKETPSTDTDKTVSYEFEHYQLGEMKRLDDFDDIGVMIADFDSDEGFKTYSGMKFTSKKNKYVQGVGSIDVTDMRYHSFPLATFEPIDISAYAKGSVHLSIYINNPDYFGETGLTVELSSSGTADKEELSWTILPRFLKAGWNDLYLGIEQATKAGEPNLSAINFFRIYNLSVETCAEVYLDAFYATNKPGMDFNKYPSTKPGYLLDFDTVDEIISSGTVSFTDEKGMYKEGIGAVKVTNPKTVWAAAKFKAMDISDYQRISFWLYVDDEAYVKDANLFVELTSSGRADKEEVYWIVSGATLQTGWNEVVLALETAITHKDTKFNATNANYFRIYATNHSEEVTIIMDGLKPEKNTTRIITDGVISDCDTKSAFSSVNGKITNVDGEYKQGAGAIKTIYSGKTAVWAASLKDLVDVSHYKEGGITFWMYVDDASKLSQAVYFEIRSGVKTDVDEYQWRLPYLESGWNEIRLPFEDATVAGQPDLSRLCAMRLFDTNLSGEVTIIIDDICAVEDASERLPEGTTNDSAVEGMLFSGDSFKYMKLLNAGKNKITRTQGEYVQGTGAYKSTGAGQVRLLGKLYEPKDISAYLDGGIQFSLFIKDKSAITSDFLMVELTSSGTADKEEVYWMIPVSSLKNGWNTVNLLFDNITGKQGGDIDYTQVDFMRIYFNGKETSEDIVMILDNIHAVHIEDTKEPLPEGTTDDAAVEGMIFSGDSLNYIKMTHTGAYTITREEDEYVQGTGAYKSTGAGQIRLQGVLSEPKDISAYLDGGIQFSLYIKDKSVITSDFLMVELTSSGTADKEEVYWMIPVSSLKNGWNTVNLLFENIKGKQGGDIDYTQVDFMRIYFIGNETSKDIVMILDNIHAVHIEDTKEPLPEGTTDDAAVEGMIFSGDSLNYIKILHTGAYTITREEGEYVQGTGAYKSTGAGQVRLQGLLSEPKDISAYRDGGIQFSLFIKDKSVITSEFLMVELTSSGTADKEEVYWMIPVSGLNNGWNTVNLLFENIKGKQGGDIDYTQVDFMRIYFIGNETSKDIVMMIDDIHAIQGESDNPEQPDNPDNPEQPDNPDNPEQPDNPDNPEQPDNPDNPEQQGGELNSKPTDEHEDLEWSPWI